MFKRNDGQEPASGLGSAISDKSVSVSSSRRLKYSASQVPGPHRPCPEFRSAASAALSPFADRDHSGSLTGRSTASVFLARAPVAADPASEKPAYEYASEYRQSSPAAVLRPTVLRMAAEYSTRQPVQRSQVMRTEFPVASALATGSPRDVLLSMSRRLRQTAQSRLRLSLRKRFAAPGV